MSDKSNSPSLLTKMRHSIASIFAGDKIDNLETRVVSLQSDLNHEKKVSTKMLRRIGVDGVSASNFEQTLMTDQKKMKQYMTAIGHRENYSQREGEVVTYSPEAIDAMYARVLFNSTARPILQVRLREFLRNGYQISPLFESKCRECGTDYDYIADECDNDKCGSTNIRLPDTTEIEVGEKWIRDKKEVNSNGQNLPDLQKKLQIDLDVMDDCWIAVEIQYYHADGRILAMDVQNLWRVHPANIAFSVDDMNRKGRKELTCLEHRDTAISYRLRGEAVCQYSPRNSKEVCGNKLHPVYAVRYRPGTQTIIFRYLKHEILHSSLHVPSALYGIPPAVSQRNPLDILNYQEVHLANYYREDNYHKIRGYIVLKSGNVDAVNKQVKELKQQLNNGESTLGVLMADPDSGGKAADFIPMDFSPAEMKFNETRNEMRQRLSAQWAVMLQFQADPSAGGGLNNDGLQMVVTTRAIEDVQNAHNDNILTPLSRLLGMKDHVIELKPPEEQDQVAEIDRKIKMATFGQLMRDLGFKVNLSKDEEKLLEFKEIEDAAQYQDEMLDVPEEYRDLYETPPGSNTYQEENDPNQPTRRPTAELPEGTDQPNKSVHDMQGAPKKPDKRGVGNVKTNGKTNVRQTKATLSYASGLLLCADHNYLFDDEEALSEIEMTNEMDTCNYPSCDVSFDKKTSDLDEDDLEEQDPEEDLEEEDLDDEPYTFTDNKPPEDPEDWVWADDYEPVELVVGNIDDINRHPDYEIKESDIEKNSERVRPKTIIYYLTETDVMDPLVTDMNDNQLDGHHRDYCLRKKGQKQIKWWRCRSKEGKSSMRKLQANKQLRAPSGGITINGEFFAGGAFIPKTVSEGLSVLDRKAVEEGRNVGDDT